MSVKLLLREFNRVANGAGDIASLRQAILDLAVQGRLVPQDPRDEWVVRGGAAVEPPSYFPKAWKELSLGDLLAEDSRNGYSRKPDGAADGTPILKISAGTTRQDGVVDEAEYKLIGAVSPGDRERLRLRRGDLLACRFNGNRNAVGILTLFMNTLGLEPIFPDKLIRLRPDTSSVLPELLRWWSRSTLIRQRTDEYRATTVGNWGISAGNLKLVAYPVPPLAEQHRIVAKVDQLMALCDELEDARTDREARRDRLRMISLRNLVAPDESRDGARFFLRNSARMITKPEHVANVRQAIWDLAVRGRLVPRLRPWLSTTLGNLGRWGSGGTPSTGNRDFYGGSIPWVVIGDLNEAVVTHTAQTITEAGVVNSSAKLIDPGTLLVAMYGASVGKLGIAGMRCATNQAIAHCVPDPTLIERDYLFLLLRSIRSALVASAKGGAQPNISQTLLKSWQVELPSIPEQRSVVAKMDELMAVCDELEQSLAAAQTERSRLLEALLYNALENGQPGPTPAPVEEEAMAAWANHRSEPPAGGSVL